MNREPAIPPATSDDWSGRPVETRILDNLADGLLAVDLEWRVVSINLAAEKLTGFTRKQALGKFCYELFQSTRCGDACPVRKAIQTGEPQRNVLLSSRHRKGTRTWMCISASAVRDDEGTVIGGLEVLRHAACIQDACCETEVEIDGAGACEHAERAQLIREAQEGHSRPSHRAILSAELRPENLDARTAEAEKLLGLLQAHGWNRQRTAETLGISRSTLWRRMKEFGLID